MPKAGFAQPRRFLSAAILLLTALLASSAAAGQESGSETFDDVPAGHWAEEAIGWGVANDLTRGVGEGRFDPNGTVTRAQIVTFLHRAVSLILETQDTVAMNSSIIFVSDHDGDRETVVMNADGTNPRQLTNNDYEENWGNRSPDGTKTVFSRDSDGDTEIFVMNADGTNPRQLTNNTHRDSFPSWAPDGTRIAFQSNRDGDDEIFVMNADGTDPRQLTHNTYFDSQPRWSPDSKMLTFTSNRDGDPEVFVMDAEGTEQRQLTHNDHHVDILPSWSPDGNQITFSSNQSAYTSYENYDLEIFVINADGTEQRQVTHNEHDDLVVGWSHHTNTAGSEMFRDVPAGHWADRSIGWAVANGIATGTAEGLFDPNGTVSRAEMVTYLHRTAGMLPGSPSVGAGRNTRPTVGNNAIAFQSDRDGDDEIFMTNLDGTNQYQLTHNIFPDSGPVWSPDGTQIAFQNPFIDLFVVNTDGTNLRRISNARHPVWSPDSTRIAFRSYEPTTGALSLINADGTDRRQLTSNDHHDWSPTWSPDGTQIAFQSDRTGRSEIFVADADGAYQRQLTQGGGSDPIWSPDGARIAFTRQDQGHFEVYVISPDGTNQFRLTSGGGFDPIWSPDGKRLALAGVDDDGDTEIHIADFFGDTAVLLRQMTYDDHNDFAPRWSNDGTKIVHLNAWYGISIIAMGPNSLLRLGLNQPGWNPMWSPDSSQIIFEVGDDVFVMDQYGRDKRRLLNLRGSDIFHDVPTWHTANVQIGWAVTYGVTAGVGEGLFDPSGTVTRAQIITFLHRLVALVRLSNLDLARSTPSDPDEGFEAATVRMGMSPCCADLAFWQIPIEKGWLQDLNVRIDPPGGHKYVTSTETVTALRRGDLDVATAWIPHALERIEIDSQTLRRSL